jgi:uncharacterized membrane protein YdjX (TVP38/TMEM64 family)
MADALFFSFTHDVLQIPAAIENSIKGVRPRGRVVAVCARWDESVWPGLATALFRRITRRYVTTFDGFGRPWSKLVKHLDNVTYTRLYFGTVYIVKGIVKQDQTRTVGAEERKVPGISDEEREVHNDGSPGDMSAVDKPLTSRILALLTVVLAFTIVSLVAVDLTGGAARFRSIVENSGAWAPVVYVLLKATTYVLAPLSGTSLKLASGAVFGTWQGFLYTLVGDVFGGSINFWIARSLGRAGIKKAAGRRAIAQVDAMTSKVGGWKALLVARILLSTIYDFISYAAGLSSIRYAHYLVVTAVGGIPPALFFAAVGDASVSSNTVTAVVLAVCSASLVVVVLARMMQRHRR